MFGLGPMAFAAERERVEALRRELAGADRLTVLRVKAAVCRRPEYGRAIRSVDVYEAVARGGVTTAEEFDAWLRRRRASRAICQ